MSALSGNHLRVRRNARCAVQRADGDRRARADRTTAGIEVNPRHIGVVAVLVDRSAGAAVDVREPVLRVGQQRNQRRERNLPLVRRQRNRDRDVLPVSLSTSAK